MFLNWIGENVKLELVDDRLGVILGVGVRNDVAKLVLSSIYRENGRWPRIFGRDARWSEVRKNAGGVNTCSPSWQ